MASPTKQYEINTLMDAVEIVHSLRNDPLVEDPEWPFHKFPFGLWFRGESIEERSLDPPVFRHAAQYGSAEEKPTGLLDETNLYEHLQLRAPSHKRTYQSAFDWLCLMQHYSVPTRLLDWSESILPALYFATRDDPKKTGEVIVLNARRLNRYSKPRSTISTPTEPRVILRSEMATCRSARELRRKPSVVAALTELNLGDDEKWMDEFRSPIAVFPSRLNDRMIFQSSVFTLHGGKMYPESMKSYYADDLIPDPVALETLDERCPERPILRRYTISEKAKETILPDLSVLGIHEGTLFPEIDKQGKYLKHLWWYEDKPL